jgi:hypothetical protein
MVSTAVKKTTGAGKEIKPHPRPLPLAVGSKDEPSSELDMPRLTDVTGARRDSKSRSVVKVHVRQNKSSPVEGVEEIHAKLKPGGFCNPDILQDVEVFIVKRLPA